MKTVSIYFEKKHLKLFGDLLYRYNGIDIFHDENNSPRESVLKKYLLYMEGISDDGFVTFYIYSEEGWGKTGWDEGIIYTYYKPIYLKDYFQIFQRKDKLINILKDL